MKPIGELSRDVRDAFWKTTRPPQFFSWQTLLWVTAFCWFMALVTQLLGHGEISRTFASVSTLMLGVAGIVWAIVEKPLVIREVSLAPWLAGALSSTLLYRLLSQNALAVYGNVLPSPQLDATLKSSLFWSVILFPILSLCIKVIPDLLYAKPRYSVKPNHRLPLAMLIFSHVLVVAWIRFSFLIQDWINADPLLTNRAIKAYQGSMFVFPIDLIQ